MLSTSSLTAEVPREFYAEYPIKISVTGQYHEFGQFVSGLSRSAANCHASNIDISEVQRSHQRELKTIPLTERLKMDLGATTYRYLEEE